MHEVSLLAITCELTFIHAFAGSLCSMSQVVVPDSYYDILWRAFESEPQVLAFSLLFFMFVNVFDTFLLLGLFVAVVTGTFKRVREAHAGQSSMLSTEQEKELIQESQQENALVAKGQDSGDEDLSGEEAMQNAAKGLVKSETFTLLVSLTIVVHTAAMGFNTYNAEQWARVFFQIGNLVCSIIFMLELTLNFIAAGGFAIFWRKLFHRFEVFLVLSGLLGLITNSQVLVFVPAFRIYRLMKYFPTLHAMLESAVASVQAIVNVMVFILIVMLCFIVAARYMLGNRVDEISRSSFGSFSQASLTMFQLLTGDSWSGVMYSAMIAFDTSEDATAEAAQTSYVAQFFGAFLVMSWFLIASLIAQNLFVAVIIENFQITDTIQNIGKPGRVAAFRSMAKQSYKALYKKAGAVAAGELTIDVNTGLTHPVQATRHRLLELQGARKLYTYDEIEDQLAVAVVRRPTSGIKSKIMAVVSSVSLGIETKAPTGSEEADEPERVLFCLTPNNPIRKIFQWISNQPAFDTLIYLSILLSCFFLIVERPYPDMVDYPGQESNLEPLVPITADTMALLNSVMTFLFTVEFGCRVMAQGLLTTKRAYLKSGWNIVDSIVLAFAWFEELSDGPNAKVLRMGRALKPLRLMKRNENMRVVIDALISTLQPLVYVIMFLLFTLIVFSVIAMGLFGGKLHSCNDPVVVYPLGKLECSGVFVRDDGVVMPSQWSPPYTFSFDNYGLSFLSLLQVSTFKYVSILSACVDVTEVDSSPKKDASMANALFLVVYIFFGALFVMNLFVGFIIDGFNANKGTSPADMIYGRFRRQLRSFRPKYDRFPAPTHRICRITRSFFESSAFQTFSTLCVLTNIGFLLSNNADAEEGTSFAYILEVQDSVFYGELCFEVVLMAIAYGLGGFYNDAWRGFDLFVAAGQTVGLASGNPMVYRFSKIFRLARVVRLAARIKSVRVILETFVHTVPQLTNIMVLIALFYSMFAIVGVTFFATTRAGQRIGKTASFSNFWWGVLTIWQIVTGDEWHVIMVDLQVQPPECDLMFTKETVYGFKGLDRSWGDCGQTWSFAYLLMIKLMCEYMLLNLFIGLILDNFSYITEDIGLEEDALWSTGPSEDQLLVLRDVFMMYDLQTGYVPLSSLHALLSDLPLPLGYRRTDGTIRFKQDDSAAEQLVRAELNLAIRHRNEMIIQVNRDWFRRLGILSKMKPPLFVNGVDFETVVVTLVHWRLPNMVPNIVKWQRQDRVDESALMAHALQAMGFFRMLVGRRRRKRIGEMVAKRSRFIHWSDHDPHRKRRNLHFLVQRTERKGIADDAKLPLLHFLPDPTQARIVICDWLLVDDIPDDLIEHNQACRDHQAMRVPQPITGVEVFRSKVSTHYVVMRTIDPNNKDPAGDLLVLDFTEISWRGWDATNTKHESFFEPRLWCDLGPNKKPAPHSGWDRIDLYIRPKEGNRDMQRRLGSIQDMQSFVVDDPTSTARRAADRARSHLRVNLGNHEYTSGKLKAKAKLYGYSSHGLSRLGSKLGSKSGLSSMLGSRRGGGSGAPQDEQAGNLVEADVVLEVYGYILITYE